MKQASSIKNLIFAIILSSAAGADVPDYYVHKDTWHESLRASREKLTEMEQAGAIGMPLPNLGGSDFYNIGLDKNRVGNRCYPGQGSIMARFAIANEGLVPERWEVRLRNPRYRFIRS